MPRLRRVVAALAVLGLASGPAWAAADRLVPLVAGWEQYFKLEWEPAERRGQPIVRGYVLNDWGMPAARMQLLVDTLDAGGNVVAQRVAWVGAGILMPGVRAYFEVPVAERSPGYRVSVFAFDWVQVGGDDRN